MIDLDKHISRALLLTSAASIALTAAPAAAQVQEDQPVPQANRSATDQEPTEIVVTAQKREEAILDIPQSVTVVGGDALERQQATTFQDYLNLVPGLSLAQSTPGNTRLVLRGLNAGGASSAVAVYVDETPFGSSTALANGGVLAGDFDTFDVARIEVLRGPQGTLYGASSLGGLLKFVTNSPKLNDWSARARAGVEFIDEGGTSYNATGVVNIPLGAVAALRGTGFYRKEAGWVDAVAGSASIGAAKSLGARDINRNEIWGGRASLLFKPSEPLTVRLTAIVQNIDGRASSVVEVDPDSLKPLRGLSQTTFLPEFSKTKYQVYTGTVEYDLGFASLLSATSYGKIRQRSYTDLSATYGPLLTTLFGDFATSPFGAFYPEVSQTSKITQEVRLVSPSSDRFEWLAGVYYTREKSLISQSLNGIDLLRNTPVPDLADLYFATVPSRYKEYAAFTNMTFHFTDRFDVTVGGRYSKNRQSQRTMIGRSFFPGGDTSTRSTENVFTYNLSPRFEISDTTALYARVAKGYRPGGPNFAVPNGDPSLATYKSDTVVNYEIGVKHDLGRRLSADFALYRIDWKDVQVRTQVGELVIIGNGGEARSQGAEASLSFRPTRGLSLTANAAYTDAELTEDTPAQTGGLDGDPLPFSPGFTMGFSGDYEWSLSGRATAFVGASARIASKQHGGFTARDDDGDTKSLPGYTTVDLRAGLQFGSFSLEAFTRNLFNSRGRLSLASAEDLPGEPYTTAIIRPRTIGLTLGAEF